MNNLLSIIIVLLIFTLCYTVLNDFGMFLFITLLLLTVYFLYEMIMEKIVEVRTDMQQIKNELLEKVNLIPNKISLLKNLTKT